MLPDIPYCFHLIDKLDKECCVDPRGSTSPLRSLATTPTPTNLTIHRLKSQALLTSRALAAVFCHAQDVFSIDRKAFTEADLGTRTPALWLLTWKLEL